MKSYIFALDCIHAPNGQVIQEMKEKAQRITYRTMREHCTGLLFWAKHAGYCQSSRQGLTLKADGYVSYWKSAYRGQPCYFLRYSYIESIWLRRETCEA